MDRSIRTVDDVLRLLDGLFAPEVDRWTADAGSSWWDNFYADRSKPVPFFVAKPDENLISYLDRGLITPGRALDLGCGPGRNALHIASAGFAVDAVDLSPTAIAWAKDRARDVGAEVHFHCGDAFTLTATTLRGPYDLIYDSGCFHHLPPHRRISYLASSTGPSPPADIWPSPASRPARWAPSSPTPTSTATLAWMAASPTHRSPCAGSSPTSRKWNCAACATSHPSLPASVSPSSGRPYSATTPTPS